MEEEEYIKQQISSGYTIHHHDGVYWQKFAPFYYKPVLRLAEITPGESRPSSLKSIFGYSHVVPEERHGNKIWSIMLLSEDKLSEYSMKSISSSKRARVRKGLKNTTIKRIDQIGALIDDIQEVCISAAKRTGHAKPPEYYVSHYNEWRSFIEREFALPQRDWWGVFDESRLIAYYYAYLVDDTMFINAAKSHTNFLTKCPNDYLLFTFLEYCRDLNDCKKVIFGDWTPNAPSLNQFKEKYGFEKTDLPFYTRYNPLIFLAKKIVEKYRKTDPKG